MNRSIAISLLALGSCVPAATSELTSTTTVAPCPPCDCDDGGSGNEPQQPEDKNSGGALKLTTLQVSQTSCVSPCTIMFSVEDVEDPTTEKPFTDLGYHWDYGDPDADETKGLIQRGGQAFLQTGETSRESDTNTALGMHTYTCEEKECTFYPGVAVANAAGDWATKWTSVTVLGQDDAFPGEQTVCVSGTGNWEGCPEGARQVAQVPNLGQWESNTRYLLHRGESFGDACMQYDIDNITVSAYGEGSEPALGVAGLGRDRSCRDGIPPSSSGFENPYWVSNITLESVRVGRINLGITYRDITLHNLDMDFTNEATGGWIRAENQDACAGNPALVCSDIPTPQGVYITDSRVLGSREGALIGQPGINVEFLSSACVSFFGLYNTEVQVAFGHNVRMECGSRVFIAHNDVNGEHLGNRGNKNAITIRPQGYSTDDMLGGTRRPTDDDKSFQYANRYISIVDNYLGKPGIRAANAARVSITQTNRQEAATTFGGLVSRNVVDLDADARPFNDASVSGVDIVCYDDNRWQRRTECSQFDQGVVPDEVFEPAVLSQTPPAVPKTPSEY
jgi:hypothetical protein